jgi:hypothetical protein
MKTPRGAHMLNPEETRIQKSEYRQLEVCIHGQPVLYMALGRACELLESKSAVLNKKCDGSACFNWSNPENVKKCPILQENHLAPEFRSEAVEITDTFDMRILAFARFLSSRR